MRLSTMLLKRRIWPLAVLALASPAVAPAQDIQATHRHGWIGVTVDYMTNLTAEQEQTVALILKVEGGSPADAAGLRVGDLITHLDGKPFSARAFSSFTRNLEAGDLVRMTLERDEQEREVLIEAGARPKAYARPGPDVGTIVLKMDSVRGAILKNLDSLRLHITALNIGEEGELSVQVLREPPDPEEHARIGYVFRMYEPTFDSLAFSPDTWTFTPDLALPFEAFLVDSEATDSLKQELKEVRSALTNVRRRELTRVREIQAGLQSGSVERVVREDELIQKLREEEEALIQEQEFLNQRLQELSEIEMKRQWADAQRIQENSMQWVLRDTERSRAQMAQQEEMSSRARAAYEEAVRTAVRRPLTPLIVGRDFVAGARIVPMTPWLAETYEVDEGVVVWEVLEGTPAHEAGLTGGDVIIRVGGEDVTSVDDLRFSFGYLKGPLRIRLIRKGEPVEVIIGG